MEDLIDEDVKAILDKRGVTDFYEAISLLLIMGYKEQLAFYTALYHYDITATNNEDCIYLYGTISTDEDIGEPLKMTLYRRKPVSDNFISYLKFCTKKRYTPPNVESIVEKVITITMSEASMFDFILKNIELMGIELMELFQDDEEEGFGDAFNDDFDGEPDEIDDNTLDGEPDEIDVITLGGEPDGITDNTYRSGHGYGKIWG